jgi:hypothetical protein
MDSLTRWSRTKSPLGFVDPRTVVSQPSTSIVSTAAAVLREELHALTRGASRLLPTLGANALTSQTAGQFPEQVQPLVETLARLLNLPPGQLTQLIGQTRTGIQADNTGTGESVDVLRSPQGVMAGNAARLSLHVENDDAESDKCALFVTDLLGPSGHRIPVSHVRVSPQPLSIPAGGSVAVQIEVRVPSGTPAGDYTGLVQADDGQALRTLIQVRVNR